MYLCLLSRHSSRSLKWKPPHENSIDFKLTLRFDASPENPHLPDLTSKPLFLLYVYRGGRGPDGYLFHDRMVVSDDEWEE
jgi:mRNA guanylyltransferase